MLELISMLSVFVTNTIIIIIIIIVSVKVVQVQLTHFVSSKVIKSKGEKKAK